jgi:hypothetical protein
MKKLSGADQQLIEAIRKDPGHVLSHYARPLCISPQLALFAIERLIARGDVKRHSCTEKLSLPAQASAVPGATKASATDDVPVFVSGWYRDTLKPKPISAATLHAAIVELLKSGDKTTRELADAMHRNARGIGPALHILREQGLITSSGPLGAKVWHLVEVPVAAPVESTVCREEITSLRARVAELKADLERVTRDRDYFENSYLALRRDFYSVESMLRTLNSAVQQLEAVRQ